MDIKREITEAQGLTPTEQQLGISALAMGGGHPRAFH